MSVRQQARIKVHRQEVYAGWGRGSKDIPHLVFPIFSVRLGGKRGDSRVFKNIEVLEKPLGIGR